ncbi:hypothetical protein [Actinacidiphila soli]|uniref:hypothetical protein n=1 Tax=Actinacidiphila soli TaxID=2487275 RepID=UPI000FCC6DA2|nr:hypothetical protein [Actinacidiphila soli]
MCRITWNRWLDELLPGVQEVAMREGFALARPARWAGAAVCGVLVLVEAGWVMRDVGLVGADGLWQVWAGLAVPLGGGPLNTSVVDLALLGLYVGAIGASTRPVATGAFGAVGAVTLLLRAPTVLILGGQWNGRLDIQGQLVLTAAAEVVGAVALLSIAVNRRRVLPGWDPAPPRPAAGVLAGLLLLIVALMTAVWQLDRIYGTGLSDGTQAQPPGFFWRTVTGGYLVNSLLGAPFGWLSWSTAALCAAAGAAALRRTLVARPLGIAVGWLLVPLAVPVIATAKPPAVTVGQFAAGFAVVVAVVVALLLVPRAEGPFSALDESGYGMQYGSTAYDAEATATQDTQTMPAYGNWSSAPPPPGPPPGVAGCLRPPPRRR